MFRILFVCHANLCRSPMAEAVMQQLIDEAGLSNHITVDSAGTHCSRFGEPAYSRVADILQDHGLRPRSVARQLQYDDLNTFSYVFTMDRRNLTFILRHSAGCSSEIALFLQTAQSLGLVTCEEVPDPYPDGDFEEAFNVIRVGCTALLSRLRTKYAI